MTAVLTVVAKYRVSYPQKYVEVRSIPQHPVLTLIFCDQPRLVPPTYIPKGGCRLASRINEMTNTVCCETTKANINKEGCQHVQQYTSKYIMKSYKYKHKREIASIQHQPVSSKDYIGVPCTCVVGKLSIDRFHNVNHQFWHRSSASYGVP